MSLEMGLTVRSFERRAPSMEITEDAKNYAAEQGIFESEAFQAGMRDKRKKFVENAAELYAKA